MNRISLRVYLLLSRDNALDSTDRFGKWSRLIITNAPETRALSSLPTICPERGPPHVRLGRHANRGGGARPERGAFLNFDSRRGPLEGYLCSNGGKQLRFFNQRKHERFFPKVFDGSTEMIDRRVVDDDETIMETRCGSD